MPGSSTDSRWSDLLAPTLRVPLAVLSTGVLLHSMNALLMSTVLPSAVRDIGGLEYMSWPSTSFLATSVIAASAGSLARAWAGARSAYGFAALLFGLGSLIAGVAPDIGWMVFGRAVQGAGGGLLSSLAYTMVRNVFPMVLWPRIFALFSSIWGVAVLAGPLIGGVFASFGYWRGAFTVVAAIALALTVLARYVLPDDVDRPVPPPFPGFRLALVSLGIVTLSLAAPARDPVMQATYIALSVATFITVLAIDRRAHDRLLPGDAFSLVTPVGLGLWVLLLITVANDPFPVYGPLFLQTLKGLDPLAAGYLVAMEAMSWTIVAAIVASLPPRWLPFWIVAGPFAMGLGLLGISVMTESAPIWLLLFPIFLAGGGIGACYSFIAQIILGHARPGDGDSAASSLATVQLVGLATGAALAGLIANVTGFSAGLSTETAAAAVSWVPGAFIVSTTIATLAGVALARHLRALEAAG